MELLWILYQIRCGQTNEHLIFEYSARETLIVEQTIIFLDVVL